MRANRFIITVEVVPPAGPDAEPILSALKPLAGLSIDAFSIATNPVAKPRMSAMALCALVQQKTGKPAILHCTTRDQNRIGLQGMLWGGRALGVETVLVATGDFVALGDRRNTTTVGDMDVMGLVRMAREAKLRTGVVFDPGAEPSGLEQAVRRLERKVAAGAQFAVTQPVYDESDAKLLIGAIGHIGIPIIMGILPLRTRRHAEFLHRRVAGITVPKHLRDRMKRSVDSVAEGVANASEMLAVARQHFAGACLMPPFDHYDVLFEILRN
jgi:homocysteine S-methyltransferase